MYSSGIIGEGKNDFSATHSQTGDESAFGTYSRAGLGKSYSANLRTKIQDRRKEVWEDIAG